MTLGIQLFASRRHTSSVDDVVRELVHKAVLAEHLGYDSVWLAEHHGTDWNRCGDPLTLLAYIAAATTRISLGTAVVNLGLHHPNRVAEQAALVNSLSHGRLELGLGRGFASSDYDKFDLDKASSDHLFRTNHDRLLTLLAATPETATIPIWLATTGSSSTLKLAVEHGHGLLVAAHGQQLQSITSYVYDEVDNPRIGLTRAVHVAADPETATAELQPYLEWYLSQLAKLQPSRGQPPVEDVLENFCVLGTAKSCLRQLSRLQSTYRVSDLMCIPGIGGAPASVVNRVLEALVEVWP